MRSEERIIGGRNGRTNTQILLAQYYTPVAIAQFMTSMFFETDRSEISILDAGAGEGILGLTLVKCLLTQHSNINATFVELDKCSHSALSRNVLKNKDFDATLINDDFIDTAFKLEDNGRKFSHIILNPPYFKLRINSPSSKKLKARDIHVTNIYAAFVWLSARLLETDGQLVAIIPRSFCNGPYFLQFRKFLVSEFSIDAIHEFTSRNKVFAKNNVLQENVILHISRRAQVTKIQLTHSADHNFENIVTHYMPVQSVIASSDSSLNIHIPHPDQKLHLSEHLHNKLEDFNITASTGPVVDFRFKSNIVARLPKNRRAIPLLYPAHMSGYGISWPLPAFKKIGQYYEPVLSKAISFTFGSAYEITEDKNVLPLDGYYVVVRRFSSKEEKRRIFASVVQPEDFSSKSITFENHLNYLHKGKHGLDKDLAYGLCAYLNSELVDEYFRKISGHTQVNANDLRHLPYPSKDRLTQIGILIQAEREMPDEHTIREVLKL